MCPHGSFIGRTNTSLQIEQVSPGRVCVFVRTVSIIAAADLGTTAFKCALAVTTSGCLKRILLVSVQSTEMVKERRPAKTIGTKNSIQYAALAPVGMSHSISSADPGVDAAVFDTLLPATSVRLLVGRSIDRNEEDFYLETRRHIVHSHSCECPTRQRYDFLACRA